MSEQQSFYSASISLDKYTGIGSQWLEINKPVAERFSYLADMRQPIEVVKSHDDRHRNYENLGWAMMMKRLNWFGRQPEGNEISKVLHQPGSPWTVQINDQLIADRIMRQTGQDDFDNRFRQAFQSEMVKGIHRSLIGEKFLNGGRYNQQFISCHTVALLETTFLIQIMRDVFWTQSMHPTAGAIYLGMMSMTNMICALDAIHHGEPNDPFTKKRLIQFPLSPIPIENYLHGGLFLANNRQRFLEQVDTKL